MNRLIALNFSVFALLMAGASNVQAKESLPLGKWSVSYHQECNNVKAKALYILNEQGEILLHDGHKYGEWSLKGKKFKATFNHGVYAFVGIYRDGKVSGKLTGYPGSCLKMEYINYRPLSVQTSALVSQIAACKIEPGHETEQPYSASDPFDFLKVWGNLKTGEVMSARLYYDGNNTFRESELYQATGSMFEVGQPNTLSTADNYKRRFSLVSTFTYRGGFKGTLTVEEDLEDGGSSTKTEVIPVRCHPMRYATTEGEKVE